MKNLYEKIYENTTKLGTKIVSNDTKVYVMSDIHGDFDHFMDMLDKIKFSDNDELYILGDSIDRGPASIACLQFIMDNPNIHMILGNHELMMIDAFESVKESESEYMKCMEHWFLNGGDVTAEAFNKLLNRTQREIFDFISNLPLQYKIELNGNTITLCHAAPVEWFNYYINCESEKRSFLNPVEYSLWYRGTFNFAQPNAGTIVIGHTPTISYLDSRIIPASAIMFDIPVENTEILNIDCGSVYRYYNHPQSSLCCIRLNDLEEYYL